METSRKQELLDEIRQIENDEAILEQKREKEQNFEKFKKRISDVIIGKAHCYINMTNINYHWLGSHKTIGDAISIHGNCGTSYKPKAQITDSTDTYFHNVWTDDERTSFQKRLNEVALEEIQKIMSSLRNKLELLGLQSTHFLISQFSEGRRGDVRSDIWKETVKVLSEHTDEEFQSLDYDGIHHSKPILKRYLEEQRPHLYEEVIGEPLPEDESQ